MLRPGNAGWLSAGNSPTRPARGWAVLVLAILLLGLGGVGVAAAQTPGASPEPLARADSALPVDWSHAKRVHTMAQGWVNVAAVPAEAPEPMPVRNAVGIQVTIRWQGRLMGTGRATVGLLDDVATTTIDLAAFARDATARALEQVQQSVDDANRRAQLAGPDVKTWTLAELAPLLAVDTQVGHSPVRVQLTDRDGQYDVYERFASGYHGLILGRSGPAGGTALAWTWPVDALSRNTLPTHQFAGMLKELNYKLVDVVKVGRRDGPPLWRFEAIHFTQRRPTDEPLRLTRGQELVGANATATPSPVDGRRLERMADQLTDALLLRIRKDATMDGTFQPSTNRYDPPQADPAEIALAILALERRLQAIDETHAHHQRLREAIPSLVNHLTQHVMRPDDRTDPATLALLMQAIVESPSLQSRKIERDFLARRLQSLQDPTGAFKVSTAEDAGYAPYPAQVIITMALTSLYDQTRDRSLLERILAARTMLWEHARKELSDTALPWMLLLEADFHRLQPDTDKEIAAGRRAILKEYLDAMRQRQIRKAPDLGPADVVGGIVIEPAAPRTAPNPTWRTAHGLMVMASALNDESLCPADERLQLMLDTALAGRFLAQLMVARDDCFYIRSPGESVGNVRATLWDNRLAVAPTAMTLLAVTETQRALRQGTD